MNYIAYLHKDPKSDYGVSFPDFPGCITAGKTLEEAQQMAAEALALHIQGMIEDGEQIPAPSTLDALVNDPARKDAVAFLVETELPNRAVRVNIMAREKQIEKIDRLASEAGMTRSAYMVQAALQPKVVPVMESGSFGAAAKWAKLPMARAAKKKMTHVTFTKRARRA